MTPATLSALQPSQSQQQQSQSSQVGGVQQSPMPYQQSQQQHQQQQQSSQQSQHSTMSPLPPVQIAQTSNSGGTVHTPSFSQGQLLSSGPGQYTQEQLWELVKVKEAMILTQQKKLVHYRAWMSTIHARVQQMNPNVIKNARRLYVGSLPEGYNNEEELKSFFSNLMTDKGGCTNPGNPILSCKITVEKSYAFLELRSVEETTNVMAFDGILFKECYLKIRRPSNYDVNSAVMLGPITPDPTVDSSGLDICRSVVEDSPNKLFVGGLPCDWSEDQVKDLLTPQGNLRSFNLVMDKMTGKSKGYAFCEFDEGTTDFVIAALNQKKVGNKVLTVKRALEGNKQGGPVGMGMPVAQGTIGSNGRVNSIGRMNSGMQNVGSGVPQSQFNQVLGGSGPIQPNLMAAMIQNPHQLGNSGAYPVSGILPGGDSFSPTSSSRFNKNSAGGNSSSRGGLEEAANAVIHGTGNAVGNQPTLNDGPNMLQRTTNTGANPSGISGSLPNGIPNTMAANNAYSMGIMNSQQFGGNHVW